MGRNGLISMASIKSGVIEWGKKGSINGFFSRI